MDMVLTLLASFAVVVVAIMALIVAIIVAVFILVTLWALVRPVAVNVTDKWVSWVERRTEC